jgi:septum formation protein
MVNFGDGIGKAGGYTINGFAESFIIKIIGQYSNIVGLPLYETRNILMSFGIL